MHNAPIEGHYLEHQNYLSPRGPAAPFSPIQMKTSSSSASWLHRSNGGNVAPLQPPSTKPSIGAPLLGCIFFLDMANDDARKLSTERQLKQLAARVEDLFNGDIVTHVITTRHLTHEQKLKIQQQALSPPPPLSSSSLASAFLPVATTTSSTPGLSSPSLPASPHPSSSSQAMTVPPSTHQPLTTSTSTSSTSTLLSPSTLGISNATASTSPNSPFSSSPSSPFSCNPAAGSYPPPQASSSPSSPSAMAAYAPPSTAGGASLRPPTPGNAAIPAPTAPHSLIEQLRYASGSGKRKESQLAMTRKAYMMAHQQQQVQATDTELSEDVIALAYRLGKKIYHIDKFAPWLEKHCSPYGSAMTTTTTTSVPRRGNESTHTTAESPIGSPQGQRNLSTNCQSTAAGPAWSTASVDMLPSLSAATAAAPFAPVMVVPSSLPPFPSGLPGSSATAASTTGVVPTTTTTKPPSPTTLPSFQAPFLMVEDLKGQFKTMYKEFPFDSYGCSTVPFLNLDAPPGCSPFLDAETIKKHKEMQRQYQQKLEQRKREKPAAGRPKRPTSAPLTRPRRPSPRERSSPQAAMQESVEMWEGEDGGGMADSSLQVPHPFRAPAAANPIATSPGSGLVLYPPSTSSSSSVVSLSSSSSSSMHQQRRLSPLSSLSASTPYCPMSSTRTSPTFAFPPLHSSAPSLNTTGTTGTPRPSKMSSSGGSHQHVRPHSHSHGSLTSSASLLARAHYPSDWRERLSASCLPPDSSGRSLGEEMEDDASTSTFMQRSA